MRSILAISTVLALALCTACWRPEVDARPSRVDAAERSDAGPPSNTRPADVPRGVSSEEVSNSENSGTSPKSLFQMSLPGGFQIPADRVGLKLLSEYGSVFVGGRGVTLPDRVIFAGEPDVDAFHGKLQTSAETIGGFNLELQTAAMAALRNAINDAARVNLTITPRGSDSAKRTYAETVSLWSSRVNPGLDHWVARGKLSRTDADRIRALPPSEQVPEILRLESEGLYFSKDFSKSILYSVAAPGASQHIFMLAFDVREFADKNVREILARHGWFQTVQSDLPHFTYLGLSESELPAKGLKAVVVGGQRFWVPDLKN